MGVEGRHVSHRDICGMKTLLLDSQLGEIALGLVAFLVGAGVLHIISLVHRPGGQVSYWSSIQQLN
jgi:hypothetical protein